MLLEAYSKGTKSSSIAVEFAKEQLSIQSPSVNGHMVLGRMELQSIT